MPVSLVYAIFMVLVRPTALVSPPIYDLILWGYRLLVILTVLEIVRRYFNTIYILEPERATRISGRLAIRIQRFSVAYIDVREVKLHQTILGRIFDYGTVAFETASKEIPELSLSHIATPKQISNYVEKLRSDSIRAIRNQKGTKNEQDIAELQRTIQDLENGE